MSSLALPRSGSVGCSWGQAQQVAVVTARLLRVVAQHLMTRHSTTTQHARSSRPTTLLKLPHDQGQNVRDIMPDHYLRGVTSFATRGLAHSGTGSSLVGFGSGSTALRDGITPVRSSTC